MTLKTTLVIFWRMAIDSKCNCRSFSVYKYKNPSSAIFNNCAWIIFSQNTSNLAGYLFIKAFFLIHVVKEQLEHINVISFVIVSVRNCAGEAMSRPSAFHCRTPDVYWHFVIWLTSLKEIQTQFMSPRLFVHVPHYS